ncbi:acyl carrier protein [Glaciimonas sp. Cout2]|uniref:acyl carrier protein n=1 Tax=Glaciimonas sp. Cout2 TaxID=3048621 RepID=UPI002B236852|nr:acyl carrier protein [Glaciimonas sp. Cout2]MEB0013452.1 acyl carrier protein [Glaciimonas sp. Cout2]
MKNNQTREDVLEIIMDIFVVEIRFIGREEISPATHVTKDFKIYKDDITIFLNAVEKRFDMLAPAGEWEKIETFNEMADLVMLYRGVKIPFKRPKGILSWVLNCIIR